MSDFFLQHRKTIVSLISFIVIPLSFFLVFLIMRAGDLNLSGLLSDKSTFSFTCSWLFLLLAWLNYMLYAIAKRKKIRITTRLFLMDILILSSFFIPYTEGNSFLSSLHITSAYAALVYMNYLFFKTGFYETGFRDYYFAVSLIAAFHAFTYGKITGFSEMLYGALVSIMLGLVYKKTA